MNPVLAFKQCHVTYKRQGTLIASVNYGHISIVRGRFVSEKKNYIPDIHQLGTIYYIVVPFKRSTIKRIIEFDCMVDKYIK